MSKEAYNDVLDESKGANTVMLANEAFTDFESFTVGTLTPTRGFSTAKFVPGSREGVVVAIKSEENAELNTQASCACIMPWHQREAPHALHMLPTQTSPSLT